MYMENQPFAFILDEEMTEMTFSTQALKTINVLTQTNSFLSKETSSFEKVQSDVTRDHNVVEMHECKIRQSKVGHYQNILLNRTKEYYAYKFNYEQAKRIEKEMKKGYMQLLSK